MFIESMLSMVSYAVHAYSHKGLLWTAWRMGWCPGQDGVGVQVCLQKKSTLQVLLTTKVSAQYFLLHKLGRC